MATAKPTKKETPEKALEKKKKTMLTALAKCSGLETEARNSAKVSYKENLEWLDLDAEYKAEFTIIQDEAKVAIKDHFIRCAISMARDANAQVVTNVLKTYCKDRGYGADGEAPSTSEVVTIEFTDED